MKQTPIRKQSAKYRSEAPLRKKWREAVRDRADGLCEVCGESGTQAHHMIPRRHKGTTYDVRNGLYLCDRCHNHRKSLKPLWDALERLRPGDFEFLRSVPYKMVSK